MKESAFQIILVTRENKEFVAVVQHARHTMEKRQRLITFLWLRMIG